MVRSSTLLSALAGDDEIAALLSDVAQIDAMVAFERALAVAEAQAGFIPDEAAAAIEATLPDYQPDWADLAAGIASDGVVAPALVRQLRVALGAHGAHLHKGATSQDVIDTALVLQLARILPIYETRLTGLLDTLDGLANRYGVQPLMAHTRMQQALPFTVAAKLRTWSEPLARHRRMLGAIRRELLVIQLGGPTGDRSSFGDKGADIARFLAAELDLGLAEPWHSDRSSIGAFAAWLSLVTGTLGKLGADVALMAQNEVGEVRLANGGGSSAMAHKSNPVAAEVLVSLARANAGLLGTLHQGLVHENERSGAAWTLEWLTLPDMLVNTGAGLRLARSLLDQMSFVEE